MLRLEAREAWEVDRREARGGMVHRAAVETEVGAVPKQRAEWVVRAAAVAVTAKPAFRSWVDGAIAKTARSVVEEPAERMVVARVADLVHQTSAAVVEVQVVTLAGVVAKRAMSVTVAVEVAEEDPATLVDLVRLARRLAGQSRPMPGMRTMLGVPGQEVLVRQPAVLEGRLASPVW